jgi:hypothetical protein
MPGSRRRAWPTSAQLSAGPGEFVSVGDAGFASTLVELDVVDEYRPFVNPSCSAAAHPTSQHEMSVSTSSW